MHGNRPWWQAVGVITLAATTLGLRLELLLDKKIKSAQLASNAREIETAALYSWEVVGSRIRRALREEAQRLGGVELVRKVITEDDMSVLPCPEMFMVLRAVDPASVGRVMARAQEIQDADHAEEVRRVHRRWGVFGGDVP